MNVAYVGRRPISYWCNEYNAAIAEIKFVIC